MAFVKGNANTAPQPAKPAEQEPVEIEMPEYHSHGMGCGLEDRGITDRYEAMKYGWYEAIDRVKEELANFGPLYTAPQPAIPPGWATAYAAFKGAFDTPLARRRDSGEYAQDARRLLREFNDAMLAAPEAPQPAKQPLTDEEIYECERIAAIRHHRHKNSIRGQQITPADDLQWHFARAIIAAYERKNGIGEHP